MKKTKRLSAILLAIIIMLTTALSAPVSAFAKTGYWVDMNVAKVNIENLKDYIYYYGDIDTDGNEYIGYTYYGSTTENNYYITYMNNSDVLKFEGLLGDNGYVSLYYNYYDLNTSVQIAFPDAGLKARVTFDCTEYYYQDLIFDPCDWCIIRPTSIWGPWFGVPYRNFFDMVMHRMYFQIGRAHV